MIWFEDQRDISKFFINEFTKRFTFGNPRFDFESFDSLRSSITEEENEELTKVVG